MIKICIDAGHGGKDRYNKGRNGYIEADGVLDISLKLRDKLLKTGMFEVKLTRDKDATLGVRERGQMAGNWGADMFISEHSNATGLANNTTRRGVDVYLSVDLKDDEFGKKMSAEVAKAMGTKDGGIYKRESTNYPGEDYYGVIDSAQDSGVKHVILIENGFHDNIEDEKILLDATKRDAIAEAQARVICEFYNIKMETKEEVVEMNWKQKIVKEAPALILSEHFQHDIYQTLNTDNFVFTIMRDDFIVFSKTSTENIEMLQMLQMTNYSNNIISKKVFKVKNSIYKTI